MNNGNSSAKRPNPNLTDPIELTTRKKAKTTQPDHSKTSSISEPKEKSKIDSSFDPVTCSHTSSLCNHSSDHSHNKQPDRTIFDSTSHSSVAITSDSQEKETLPLKNSSQLSLLNCIS
ncbi:hypothetical protein PCASD_16980 [Puccinia coronata f. sp. avenae]|uniref:Uncharacterized protein n=1 Tax=Puccinia coronata f. sp. avenae TaxID=200324 RepID=A0A2N5U2X8_9BASI|nr:hypothetical protein PCASD_16980 [Puccinia coronata f. sp. avenae]